MEDIERGRIETVQRLEAQLRHLQAEHDRYKATAELWEPVVTTIVDSKTNDVQVGLRFGGKNVHVVLQGAVLSQMDSTSATTSVLQALVNSLVIDRLRTMVAPEIERVQKNVISTAGAGKW